MGGYFENSGDLNFRRLVMLERVLVSIGIGVCILWSPGFSFCHSKKSVEYTEIWQKISHMKSRMRESRMSGFCEGRTTARGGVYSTYEVQLKKDKASLKDL